MHSFEQSQFSQQQGGYSNMISRLLLWKSNAAAVSNESTIFIFKRHILSYYHIIIFNDAQQSVNKVN